MEATTIRKRQATLVAAFVLPILVSGCPSKPDTETQDTETQDTETQDTETQDTETSVADDCEPETLPQLTAVACGELMTVQDVAEITDGIPLLLETNAGEVEVSCGWLQVPESRAGDAPSGCVALPIAVVGSWGSAPAADPVIHLTGGPGYDNFASLDLYEFWGILASRDVVFIGQRGTEHAQPSLMENSATAFSDYIEAGFDLMAYSTPESAQDVLDLIEVFEWESVNLLGYSYGSRYALEVLRQDDQRVRSVVIGGIRGPEVDLWQGETQKFYDPLWQVFDNCAKDADCASDFSLSAETWQERFHAVTTALSDQGGSDLLRTINALKQALIEGDGEGIPSLIDALYAKVQAGETLTPPDAVSSGRMYISTATNNCAGGDASACRWATRFLLASCYQGDLGACDGLYYEPFVTDKDAQAVGASCGERVSDSSSAGACVADLDLDLGETSVSVGEPTPALGMASSIECREVAPYTDAEQVIVSGYGDGSEVVQEVFAQMVEEILMDFCMYDSGTGALGWDVTAAPESERNAVESDATGLLLSGEYDVLTPPAWGDSANAAMDQTWHMVLPGTGHGTTRHSCVSDLITDYFADPSARPTRPCYTGMVANRIPFLPPEDR